MSIESIQQAAINVNKEIDDQIANRKAIRGDNYAKLLEFMMNSADVIELCASYQEVVSPDDKPKTPDVILTNLMFRDVILRCLSRMIRAYATLLNLDEDVIKEVEDDTMRLMDMKRNELQRARTILH